MIWDRQAESNNNLFKTIFQYRTFCYLTKGKFYQIQPLSNIDLCRCIVFNDGYVFDLDMIRLFHMIMLLLTKDFIGNFLYKYFYDILNRLLKTNNRQR